MKSCAGLFCAVSLAICLSGCSSGEKELKLAAVDGTISFEGKPLAGATVILFPEKGPIATATTTKDGNFRLLTGGKYGAVIGNSKITITVTTPGKGGIPKELAKQPTTPEESAAYMKKAAEMQQSIASGQQDVVPKSLIPEKYGKQDTTPLSYPVKADGNNHFKIEVQ